MSDAPTVQHPAPWWQGAVIYQVYPRSFADSNGDGVGDLAGILGHLDHVAALGVDAIWLSPIYPSPLHDVGYDITDYTDIAAEYGTLADLDALIAACHARGLRLLLDLVPCHTSVEHPWFAEARASRASARRDWYIWADPATDGGPPNNWVAAFGSSSWELDPPSGQYYLHSFYPEQPDLNWRNPAVATAIHDVMRFWFERGVDGFRVDAIAHAIKDDQLRDNPPAVHGRTVFGIDASGHERLWNVERPEVHEVIRGMRAVSDGYPERVLIGEVYTPTEMLAGFLGHGRDDEFPLAFNFELLHSPWDATAFRLAIERSEALTPAFTNPTYALSNHDQVRHATRYGAGAVRLAALLLLDAARHDHDLRRRGDRPGGCGGPARPALGSRRPRRAAHADAVGCQRARRLHERPPVAAGDGRGDAERGRPGRGSGLRPQPLPAAHRPPSRAARPAPWEPALGADAPRRRHRLDARGGR